MKLSIILSTLLSTISTTVPNLCDDVYLDASGEPITDAVGQTLSRFCKWTGPNAPVWDANVCCTFDGDGAMCTSADAAGRCPTSRKRMYCNYGELVAGGVICYQPFPSMCDAGLCIDAPEILPVAQMIDTIACCNSSGACQWFYVDEVFDCQGEVLACNFGVLNDDGSVECWD